MKRYNSYKTSEVRWIGEIPSHWSEILNGILFKENVRKPSEKDVPLSLSQKDGLIPTDQMKESSLKTASYDGWKAVKKDDLVLNRFKAHLGVLMASNYEGMVSFHYGVYEPQLSLVTKYYEYLFHLEEYKGIYAYSSKGMTVGLQNLSNLSFYSIKGLYPPVSEQKAIVSFLENKISEIDEFVAKVENEIELLKEYKQAIIAHVVTHGLNSDTPTKPSGISWIGEIPENWEVKRLGSAFIENRTLNSNLSSTEAYKFNYGALVRKDEDMALTDDVLETYRKYTLIRPNDILINGLNLNYDFVSQRVAMSFDDGIITSAYLAITPRENINPSYYCYLLKSMDAKKMFHGMGTGIRLTLSFAELKKQLILFPPVAEQEEIVSYINQKSTEIDRLVVELTYQVEYLKEYKQRLIADVVTGKIKVQ